jgi:uncharacterized protein (TIGR03437 family)
MLMTSFGEAICTKSVVGEEGKTMSVQTANAANYRLGPTPGSVASIFGFELDPAAKVLVNGVEAPITYRSNTQLNVVIPKSVPLLTVEDGNGGKKQVPRYELRVLDGTGEVIAFDSYQAPIYSPGLFSASKNSDGALVVYGTGIVPPNASSSLKTLVYIKGRRFTPTSVESSPNTPGLDTVTLKQASVLPGQAIRVALEESCSGTENGCKSRLRRIRSNVVRMQ